MLDNPFLPGSPSATRDVRGREAALFEAGERARDRARCTGSAVRPRTGRAVAPALAERAGSSSPTCPGTAAPRRFPRRADRSTPTRIASPRVLDDAGRRCRALAGRPRRAAARGAASRSSSAASSSPGSAGISSGTRRSQRALAARVAHPARQAHRAASPPGRASAAAAQALAFGFVNVADRARARPARRRGVPRRRRAAHRTSARRRTRWCGPTAARPASACACPALVLHGARDGRCRYVTRSSTRAGSTRRCA